ncbi:MAG: diguanylate cyclase, partial [Candidatus Obscuribacterales bacterium]|nr:diguanylate cyclase [Candidatus Obscuribacterales bacterium]
VDDDQFFAKRASKILFDKGIDTQILTEPSKILDKLQEFSPDLIILDLMMPFISGFDICKMLRTIPRWQDLPIVFVPAQTGLATRIAAFACGADDYLPKPLSDDELVARVTLRVERSRNLKDRAERDPVTGLLIRRGFMERFNAALGHARRISQPVSLVLFDLDKFKSINDNYGHLAGDAVLAGLGRLMAKRFRVEDLRGRWGGDEFVLAFVGSDRPHSIKLMQGFLEEYCAMTFTGEHGETFSAALSAGIASFPDDSDSSYELMRIADQRLYLAKSKGRKQVVAETPVEMTEGR